MPRRKVGVEVAGLDELDRRLRMLPDRIRRRVVRKATLAGAKLVLAEAKRNAPVDTGSLQRALEIREEKSDRNAVRFKVGFPGGFARFEKVFYPAIQEYGSRKRNIRPVRYMTRAYENAGPAAKEKIVKALLAGVEAEVKALGKS